MLLNTSGAKWREKSEVWYEFRLVDDTVDDFDLFDDPSLNSRN